MVEYNDLKLNINDLVQTFDFHNQSIEVKQYLPINDKKDLIQIALQKSEENGVYNQILLDVYFNLNLVYLYTNIEIAADLRGDEFQLYDEICSSGLLDLIIGSMNADEYDYLYKMMSEAIADHMNYKNSAAAVLQSIIQDLPANAAAAADIINNWDSSKFESVQDMLAMAKQTGMSPSIPEPQADMDSNANVVSFLEEQAQLDQNQE